jgi:hypothetical protein
MPDHVHFFVRGLVSRADDWLYQGEFVFIDRA